jgi:uncharacterized protein (UPF0333 family)
MATLHGARFQLVLMIIFIHPKSVLWVHIQKEGKDHVKLNSASHSHAYAAMWKTDNFKNSNLYTIYPVQEKKVLSQVDDTQPKLD